MSHLILIYTVCLLVFLNSQYDVAWSEHFFFFKFSDKNFVFCFLVVKELGQVLACMKYICNLHNYFYWIPRFEKNEAFLNIC